MRTKVFAVYDSKSEAYGVPFFAAAVGAAVRMFSDAVNDRQTIWNKHSSDYILYQVGEFDDGNGEFSNVVPPLHLGVGSEFKQDLRQVPGGVVPVEEVLANGSKEA